VNTEFPKIQSLFKRDPATKYKTFLNEYSRPEFGLLQGVDWLWTEKVDGTNIRIMYDGTNIRYGGRTDRAQIPAILINHLQDTFIKDKMDEVFNEHTPSTQVTLYGEGYGAKIQRGGGDYRSDAGFILFDVKIDDLWLKRSDVEDVSLNLGIPAVPIITVGSPIVAVKLVQEGFTSHVATCKVRPAEGLVGRPLLELFDRRGERIITKLKTRDYPN